MRSKYAVESVPCCHYGLVAASDRPQGIRAFVAQQTPAFMSHRCGLPHEVSGTANKVPSQHASAARCHDTHPSGGCSPSGRMPGGSEDRRRDTTAHRPVPVTDAIADPRHRRLAGQVNGSGRQGSPRQTRSATMLLASVCIFAIREDSCPNHATPDVAHRSLLIGDGRRAQNRPTRPQNGRFCVCSPRPGQVSWVVVMTSGRRASAPAWSFRRRCRDRTAAAA